MSYKGTIIETHGNRSFVMNDKCEFHEIRTNGNVIPGDEIEYFHNDISKEQHAYSFKKIIVAVASLVLFILLSFSTYQQMAVRSVYAYIALDVNPSIEIGINKNYKIIRVTGLNEEGQGLIKDSHLLKTDLNLALSEIIKQCSLNHYLSNQYPNYIGVSLCFPGSVDAKGLLEQLDNQMRTELVLNNLDAKLYFLIVDKNTRQEGLKNNVSPIKYVLWEQSKKRNLNFTLAEEISLKDPQINQIASQIATRVSIIIKEEGREAPNRPLEVQTTINRNSPNNPTPGPPETRRNEPSKEAVTSISGTQNQGAPVNPESTNTGPDKKSSTDGISQVDKQEPPSEKSPEEESGNKGPANDQTGKTGEKSNSSSSGDSGRRR